MRIIALPRGGGKTTELIKISADALLKGDRVHIVCVSPQYIYRIMELAANMEANIPYPLTWQEFNKAHFGRRIDGFLIDDLEMCLQVHYPSIQVATMTTNLSPKESL